MKWKNERYQTFQDDMENAGWDVQEYRGKFYFHGPAVQCEREQHQKVLRATNVKCQWDSMGLGMIVYPC